MPSIKAKTSVKRPAAAPEREDHRAFVAAIGRLVRLARAKRGMTRRQLAHASGASERYLAQIEGGDERAVILALRRGRRPLHACFRLDGRHNRSPR